MTGFINVNKAVGASSAKEVSVIKRLCGVPCGHMGTLDPMASGVLPVAIGNASRLFDYFLDKRKKYVATFFFGSDSDTLDATGDLVLNAGRVPSREEIEEVLPSFIGEISQIPPKYSAKNVNGKRGYRLAREGVDFELPPKKVKIFSVKIVEELTGGSFVFEIECGGGTYIRSLARDIAKKLSTCAVMSALCRTQSGIFDIKDSVESINLTKDNIMEYIIPTEDVLPYESLYPDGRDAFRLFNGLTAECGKSDGIYKIYKDGTFYGLAEAKDFLLKVRTKLC